MYKSRYLFKSQPKISWEKAVQDPQRSLPTDLAVTYLFLM